MNYTEPFLREVETAQEEEQQHHNPQSGVSYRAAVAANNKPYLHENPTLFFYWVAIS